MTKAGTMWKAMAGLALAGGLGVAAGAFAPSEARACYDDYFTSDWCYDPFLCNYNPTTSVVMLGNTYRHYTFGSIPCSGCPDQSYDTEYGLDYPCDG